MLLTTLTDGNGEYRFPNLLAGDYEIQVIANPTPYPHEYSTAGLVNAIMTADGLTGASL